MIKKIICQNSRLTSAIVLAMLVSVLSLSFFWGHSQDIYDLRKKLEIQEQFNIAMNLYHQKSYSLASSYFLDVLKKDSQHFFGRYYLSLCFFLTGKTDEAIRETENLIRIHGLNRNLEQKINFFSKQKFLENPKRDFTRYVWIRDYPNIEAPSSLTSPLGNSINSFSILRKKGYRLRTPIHLQVSQNQELLVLDFSLKNLFRLDSDGFFLGDIYGNLTQIDFSANSGQKRLGGPWAFSPLQSPTGNEEFWVTDFINDNIKVMNKNGTVLSVIGEKGIGETNFLGIKGITLDEYGNFYIADSGNGRIQFRNQKGDWLKNIGQRGDSFGTLLNPIDVAYDHSRRQIYVLDKGNVKVTVFSVEGDFLEELSLNDVSSYPNSLQKIFLDNPRNPSHLYLLDAKSLYRLRLNTKQWEKIEISRQKGVSQFTSVAMGEDGYLYLGNALREKVEVFAPVEKTYVNLPVLVKSIDIKKFPIVKLRVGVKDLIGHPVKFLQSRNFSLHENRVSLPFKLMSKPEAQQITLLVEKSTTAQEREFTIQAFMESLFNQLTRKDSVKVITYNQSGHTEQTPFAQFKLAAIEKTLQNNYTQGFVVDSALQAAINHTKNPNVKSAVVVLAFTPHEAIHFRKKYINLVQTLKNNDVPVYIFYAGSKTTDTKLFHLQNLSRQTRGQFYFYDQDALSRFKNDFHNYHDGVYTLQYVTSSDPRNRGVFRRVGVNVRYKNSQGEDSLAGYPLP